MLSEGAGKAIEGAVQEQTTTPNIWKLIRLLNDGLRRGLLVPGHPSSSSRPSSILTSLSLGLISTTGDSTFWSFLGLID